MPRKLQLTLHFFERFVALGVLVAATRRLPELLAVALLMLCFVAFRHSVMRDAALFVAESLQQEGSEVKQPSWRDFVLDVLAVVGVALGAAAYPEPWGVASLLLGGAFLAYNAPRRAAARLLKVLNKE